MLGLRKYHFHNVPICIYCIMFIYHINLIQHKNNESLHISHNLEKGLFYRLNYFLTYRYMMAFLIAGENLGLIFCSICKG